VRADDEPEDYEVNARVVRISMTSGDVSLKRNGNTDWEKARLNFPLVEGDTVSTDRESRLELQIDARNFVRISSGSVLRIVTLRDEGVALSVMEGTATIRLAKFDRSHEYFEIDAPRTTLAAEKKGLYRVDVPQEGRVRFTVRDGGSARIYSDTAGFQLRDGRAAELAFTADNTGDWEFVAAGPSDAIDAWVSDRERYLAQRLRYDVQYYDEYVWGAEDLDAYGDWAYTTDFGWTWRPHATVVNAYYDWAPYRYGYWTWCPPYGWTWVGYEPWGWAPYHYGRWVYDNGGWAWCPRSQYFRNRSWWRPALVAFIHLDFSNDYCWYPLHYRQRDPHSRYYTKNPARLTALRADEIAQLRRVNPAQLRAVTTASANQLGSDNLRARRADAALARRAFETTPLRGLPARAPANVNSGSTRARETVQGQPTRVTPNVQGVGRPTGAAARQPGVQLDDELRRSRVFNGREPRAVVTTENSTTSSGATETRPTGAIARPAPATRPTTERVDEDNSGDVQRQDRMPSAAPRRSISDDSSPSVRPSQVQPDSDSGEKRSRGIRVEPSRPAPQRNDSSTPTYQPPPSRSESAPTRSEAPPQRSEAPTRSEPPRSEAPRSEPARSEPREAPSRPSRPDNYEPPQRSETPSSEPPRSEPSRSEAPRSEQPRSEPSRSEAPRSEPARTESPRSEPTRSEPSRSESPRSEPTRSEPSRSEAPRSEPTRSEPSRSEAPRSEPTRSEPARPESPRSAPETSSPRKPDNPKSGY